MEKRRSPGPGGMIYRRFPEKGRTITSLRYRGMFLFDPVFFFVTILFSFVVQSLLLKNNSLSLLVLYYLIQLVLVVSAFIGFRHDVINRSFLFYVLSVLSFSFFSFIYKHPVYFPVFIFVLLSSLIYRIRRTAVILLIFFMSMIFQERITFSLLLSGNTSSASDLTLPLFVLFSSFLAGMAISIIVYYLEKSFSEMNTLVRTLENKNIVLNREKENSRLYRDALMGNELKFKTILEYAFDGISILNEQGSIKFVSNSTEKITGFNSEEFSDGAINFDRIHHDDRQRVVENFRNIMDRRELKSTVYFRYLHKDGEWRNLEVTVSNLSDNPGIEGILFIYRDVTEYMKAEQRARYFEFYDQLTGLPNQLMFAEKISEEIERSSARSRSFAVMCLGINDFKDINGQYGTNFGDIVLKQIGSRLKSNFRGDDLVSRMMGDKFLILFSDMKSENDVIAIVQKTMKSFDTPFWISNRDIVVSASVGISIFPNDGKGKDELIKNSETALFICKENRKRQYALFNRNQNEELIRRIQIEKEIYSAIEKKAFTVYFQPKVDITGVISGAEALIRWFNGERGMISPGEFIPISERNRSIIEIGKIMLEKTFSLIRDWQTMGIEPVEISINVAPLQFSDPTFVNYVEELQHLYSIDPGIIEFEITETGIMENERHSMDIMRALIDRGFSISIDDFGTGYSSLNKLKDYPVSTLKIDKSFIDSVPDNPSGCNIVKTIIGLAHSLGYKVVAEGVETAAQVELLSHYGCDMIQGYYFHKPMPSNQFEKLLKKPVH